MLDSEDIPRAVRRAKHRHVRPSVAIEISGAHRAPGAKHLHDLARRVVDDVQLAVGVETERADVAEHRAATELCGVLDEVRRLRLAGGRIDRQRQRPHAAPDEVGEEIPAAVRRPERAAAIDVSAGDRRADACGRIRESDRSAAETRAGAT